MTLPNHSINPAPARRGVSAAIAAGALTLAVALAVLLVPGGLSAQEGGAAAIEVAEMKTALSVATKQLAEAEKKTARLEAANGELRESLAESNRVGEEMRAQYEELLLRMASFGVDLVKPDAKSLEQRLLQAVRDREAAGERTRVLAGHLAELSESVVSYLQTVVSTDPQAQSRLDQALATAGGALGDATRGTAETSRQLTDGQVVSVDSEIGLVVLNVGRESGVRIGLPIELKRDERSIGTALVVDVRESISGALMQETSASDGIRVGDRIQPRAETL